MCHTPDGGVQKPGIIDFIKKADIFLRRKKNTFRRIIFHDNLCAVTLHFFKNFPASPRLKREMGIVFSIAPLIDSYTSPLCFQYMQKKIKNQPFN